MSEQLTTGKRLQNLIEQHSIKMKDFADKTGVDRSTLSRYINGKQKISDKYIQKVANLLNVSPDYLYGISDSPAPSETDEFYSQELLDYNHQQYCFDCLLKLLRSFGIAFSWHLFIGNATYILDDSSLVWYQQSDCSDYPNELDNEDYIEEIYKHHLDSRVEIWLTFHGCQKKLDFETYQRWVKSMLCNMELSIQQQFDVFYSINQGIADNELSRALRGEPPIKNIFSSTVDTNKKIDEEKEKQILRDVFGENI